MLKTKRSKQNEK